MEGVVEMRDLRPLAPDELPQFGVALPAPDSSCGSQRRITRVEIFEEERQDLVTMSFEQADFGTNGFVLSARLPVVVVDDEDLHGATDTASAWPRPGLLL